MIIAYKDLEDIIDQTLDKLNNANAGLNAAITAINNQKAAVDAARGRTVITLSKFQDVDGNFVLKENQNLFFFMAEEITNCDPVLIISIPVWTATEAGVKQATINYTVYMEDPGDQAGPKRRLMRYVRALEEVFKNFPFDNDEIVEAQLGVIEPDLLEIGEGTDVKSFYSAGIKINLTYA